MSENHGIIAIVPAAGVGARMQSQRPKQYLELQGKTVLEHSLNKLAQVTAVSSITVAIGADDDYFADLPIDPNFVNTVIGGKERADSVLAALDALAATPPQWVLVHDAARPLVSPADIERLIEQCQSHGEGGILAAKVRDTIKRGDSHVQQTIEREHLYQALTPQFFPYAELRQALRDALACGATITDEASAMEWAGHPVRLIAGRSDNFKLTTPEDLQLANFLLAQQMTEIL
ncbi:2-C-methyl-D-erythritol 4-phosphate cytidylyltransferase [Pseudoalteromonas sp. T1lg48]|uniref:2-C-methyl-D-erythritol 4-phosphate cytidylyltransferase n=1 Tax=Pseudoalteromonas sp. T1lg48 TaxID=2077100 RepID=UPI000CF6D6FB|nr:2-C-methyl-D-erythritol 4-phosphate cytidylyltransferase [Pseudoalteromonas sp. T1lg48]